MGKQQSISSQTQTIIAGSVTMDADQLEALAQADAEEEALKKEKEMRKKRVIFASYEDEIEVTK